jgi:hypothetical protein
MPDAVVSQAFAGAKPFAETVANLPEDPRTQPGSLTQQRLRSPSEIGPTLGKLVNNENLRSLSGSPEDAVVLGKKFAMRIRLAGAVRRRVGAIDDGQLNNLRLQQAGQL